MTVIFDTGRAKHPIEIQQKISTPDGSGSSIESWIGFGADRAEILPISAAERIRAHEIETEITHLLTIRYRSGITDKMKIVFRDRTFNIKSIIDVEEANVKLQLLCTEIT